MSAGESAIAIIVVFTASLRVVISLQIIVAAAPEREEGREARYVPVINIAQNARPHRAPSIFWAAVAQENVDHFRLGEDAHQKIWGEQNGRRVWLWSAQSRWTDSPRPEESAWMKFGTEKGKNTAE